MRARALQVSGHADGSSPPWPLLDRGCVHRVRLVEELLGLRRHVEAHTRGRRLRRRRHDGDDRRQQPDDARRRQPGRLQRRREARLRRHRCERALLVRPRRRQVREDRRAQLSFERRDAELDGRRSLRYGMGELLRRQPLQGQHRRRIVPGHDVPEAAGRLRALRNGVRDGLRHVRERDALRGRHRRHARRKGPREDRSDDA